MRIIDGIKFYDYEDLSKILGVSVQSVRNYIRRENLNPRIFNRRKYLTQSELDKILHL